MSERDIPSPGGFVILTREQMEAIAPSGYWRRHVRPRCSLRRAAMVGAFFGMACGFIVLVLP